MAESLTSRVEIQAYAAGHLVKTWYDFQLIDVRTQKPIDPILRPGGVAEQVPYGEYLLRVDVPGSHRSELRVKVQQPTLTIRVPVPVVLSECGVIDDSLHGTVSPAPKGRELWIKAVPLQGTGGGESRVSSRGHFLIGGLTMGQYVLLVMEGTAVLHTQVVDAFPDRVLKLTLNSAR